MNPKIVTDGVIRLSRSQPVLGQAGRALEEANKITPIASSAVSKVSGVTLAMA